MSNNLDPDQARRYGLGLNCLQRLTSRQCVKCAVRQIHNLTESWKMILKTLFSIYANSQYIPSIDITHCK